MGSKVRSLHQTQSGSQELVNARFGMVGITATQTARSSVVALAVPPNPCLVTLAFVDSVGRTIAGPTTVTLDEAGDSGSLDLSGAQLATTTTALRNQIRASVMFPPNPCVDADIIPTLEVFGVDGATSALIHPGDVIGVHHSSQPIG